MTIPRSNTEEIGLDVDNNAYLVNGKRYVRITRAMQYIPRPYLEKWREKIGDVEADRIRDETAGLGDLIHYTTELHDLGMIPALNALMNREPWLLPYRWSWKEYTGKYVKEIVWVEKVVYSEELGVAGRLDRLWLYRGDESCTIADVKSTKSLGDHIGIQLLFYKKAVEETVRREGLPEYYIPKRTVVIHLPGPREGDEEEGRVFERVRMKEYEWEKYEEALRECVEMYRALTT